ncbi:MAG: type I-C CRISPR-associated protein Cas8c/Csd1 [Nitrospinae bacterium]|nr:type I-C CRISPR-associated protein Cas8c/Csd1 [Nitrospinota bacterium]MBF0634615.1 type I-C CRISPR-associated protein Cas8c/Csd1 [Nitrospinota bacterium]
MILQALKGYYDRKAQDPDGGVAPEGFEAKEIPFVVVIDEDGEFLQIEDTRSGDGKKKRAQSFLVPQGVKKTSGVAANLLWDSAEYVFGIDTKGKPKRVVEQHAAFKARLGELPKSDKGIQAINSFLSNVPFEKLEATSVWDEIKTSNPMMTFRLQGERELVCQRASIIKSLQLEVGDNDAPNGVCLMSGESSEIERLHPSIKGVWGAQTSGANIVSFNQRSFESYGKEQKQGENAPVGKAAVFAYTTALNNLLGKDSKQRLQVGDASTVFWASAPDELETTFSDLFAEPPKDDPDRNTRAVESLYKSVQTGAFATDTDNTRFFVLGLAPNAARISVRFWQVGTVAQMAGRIRRHFDDLKIVHAPHEKPYLSLFRLLVNTAALGKAENIPPNLAGDTMRSILSGLPYPATLLQAAIRRIRAEHEVNYPRAALIKALINRNSGKEELKVSLDESNTNQAYRLGRLFAVLERAQERANPGINATIRDRYYSSASATPSTAFPILMRLKNHHISKLENRGEAVNLEKLIGSIYDGISSNGFPHQLSLEDQGRFAIGYYHQRQAFFTKHDKSEQGE